MQSMLMQSTTEINRDRPIWFKPTLAVTAETDTTQLLSTTSANITK